MAKDYDIAKAFHEIEMELIDSMTRNMKRHMNDEDLLGIDWTQWQAEMLKGLNDYKKEVKDIDFTYINNALQEAIEQAYKTGRSEQEIEVMLAIKRGYEPNFKPRKSTTTEGAFFSVNNRKMNALIKESVNSIEQAEKAILRRTDDIYRKTVFNAQLALNSGATTIEQAMDKSIRQFLAKGIDCVEYKNGTRVNIGSYAEMVLRTSNKRAAMYGASEMRDQWGIHTVLVGRHAGACPKCIQYEGKVFVDDVYGGGTAKESRSTGYPLLSTAVAGGLFHPNCKDSTRTYYEGVTKVRKPYTEEEKQQNIDQYNLEQQQRKYENEIRKYKRLSRGSFDPETAQKYSKMADKYTGKYIKLTKTYPDILKVNKSRLKAYGTQTK